MKKSNSEYLKQLRIQAYNDIVKKVEDALTSLSLITDHKNKKKFKNQTKEWQDIYKERYEKNLLISLTQDHYFDKFQMNPLNALNEVEKRIVFYRCAVNYDPNKKTNSAIHYIHDALRNEANRKLDMRKGNFPYYLSYIENSSSDIDSSEEDYVSDNAFYDSNKERVYDEYLDERGDEEYSLEQNFLLSENIYNKEKEITSLVFNILEREYNKKETGKKHRGEVYTFLMLPYLLDVNEAMLDFLMENFSFIHQKAVLHFREEKENHDKPIRDEVAQKVWNSVYKKDPFYDEELLKDIDAAFIIENDGILEAKYKYKVEMKIKKKDKYKVSQKDFIAFTVSNPQSMITHYSRMKKEITNIIQNEDERLKNFTF